MIKPPHTVAVVGLGAWGPNLLRVLREDPHADVRILCDANRDRLFKVSPLHPDATLASSLDEVLKSDVKAVVLVTPAGMHEEHVLACLDAGKDVFVEKPLALTTAAARKLVNAARERKRVLMAGHTFLFNPSVRKAGELIRAGILGKPRYILAERLSLGQIRRDVNVLWNLAPHDVSIMLDWLGAMPTRVSAHGVRSFEESPHADTAMCTLEFPGGVLVSLHVSWLAPTKVRRMLVVGTERMLRYDDVSTRMPLVLYHRGATPESLGTPDGTHEEFRLSVRQGEEEPVMVTDAEPLALEIAHFLHCLESRAEPIGSGTQALRITSVLDALNRSLQSDGAPVAPESIEEN